MERMRAGKSYALDALYLADLYEYVAKVDLLVRA